VRQEFLSEDAPPAFEAYRRNEDPALDAILAIREHVPG
jgi:hypothetical protein